MFLLWGMGVRGLEGMGVFLVVMGCWVLGFVGGDGCCHGRCWCCCVVVVVTYQIRTY